MSASILYTQYVWLGFNLLRTKNRFGISEKVWVWFNNLEERTFWSTYLFDFYFWFICIIIKEASRSAEVQGYDCKRDKL